MRHLIAGWKIWESLRIPFWECPICKATFCQTTPCKKCVGKLEPAELVHPDGYKALFIYDKVARELIHGIKYRNLPSPINWVADKLKEHILKSLSTLPDIITWIPASLSQEKNRRYDQGQYLAESLSVKLKIPNLKLIKRLSGDIPQTKRKGDRHIGPNLAPVKSKIKFIDSQNILLLDDVITSGTSILRGKLILESCGARSVQMLGIAYTKA